MHRPPAGFSLSPLNRPYTKEIVIPGAERSEAARNLCTPASGKWVPGSPPAAAPRNDRVSSVFVQSVPEPRRGAAASDVLGSTEPNEWH